MGTSLNIVLQEITFILIYKNISVTFLLRAGQFMSSKKKNKVTKWHTIFNKVTLPQIQFDLVSADSMVS